MTIYIDNDYKCHVADDGTMTAVETDYFNGKCDAYIEGYRYVPAGQTWTREDGVEFGGDQPMPAPWVDWRQLDDAQREADREELEALRAQAADMAAALEVLGVDA